VNHLIRIVGARHHSAESIVPRIRQCSVLQSACTLDRKGTITKNSEKHNIKITNFGLNKYEHTKIVLLFVAFVDFL
jgi:hypothetical protein